VTAHNLTVTVLVENDPVGRIFDTHGGNCQTLNPTPHTLHPAPYTLHPTPYTLHPSPYTLHPAPYTLHPTPYNIQPTPDTRHPTPYTLHPTPYTLHPTPDTLHPVSAPLAVAPPARRISPAGTPLRVRSLAALLPPGARSRANMAHIRQSRPDSGLGFQAKVLERCQVVRSSLGRGRLRHLLPLAALACCPSSHVRHAWVWSVASAGGRELSPEPGYPEP